jgi:protein-S-isoprenylcysteine O-methyltransferase
MDFQLTFMIVSAAWVCSELALAFFRRSKQKESDRDEGSLIWLNGVIYLSVGVVVWLGAYSIGDFHAPHWLRWSGVAIIVAGLVIRWIAIFTLQRFFTTNVAIQSGHRLVTTGIYTSLRHPAYAATLLSFLGLSIASANWLAYPLLLIPISLAFIRRIELEERVMRGAFGDEYDAYCRETSRLIPRVY